MACHSHIFRRNSSTLVAEVRFGSRFQVFRYTKGGFVAKSKRSQKHHVPDSCQPVTLSDVMNFLYSQPSLTQEFILKEAMNGSVISITWHGHSVEWDAGDWGVYGSSKLNREGHLTITFSSGGFAIFDGSASGLRLPGIELSVQEIQDICERVRASKLSDHTRG